MLYSSRMIRAARFALLAGCGLPGLAFQEATPAPPRAVSPEMRCDIMMARKKYRDAVDCFKAAADTSADHGQQDRHRVSPACGSRIQRPLSTMRRAIKLNPKYAEAINNLGTVYYARKSYRRAVSQYRKALPLRPDFGAVPGQSRHGLLRAQAVRAGLAGLRPGPAYRPGHIRAAQHARNLGSGSNRGGAGQVSLLRCQDLRAGGR